MNQRRTEKSISNEHILKTLIKDYDNDLDLEYSNMGGYYYLTKSFGNYDDREAADICSESDTCFAEALKKKRIVVCYPIPVKMVEELDIAKRNIMRHLKTNDMRSLGSSAKDRIRVAEQMMDDEINPLKDHMAKSGRDDMRAYSREYYRDFVKTKAYFGGIPRLSLIEGGANG